MVFHYLRVRWKYVLHSAMICVIVLYLIHTHYCKHYGIRSFAVAEANSRQSSPVGAVSLTGQELTLVTEERRFDAAIAGLFKSIWNFRLSDVLPILVDAKSQNSEDYSDSIFEIHHEDGVRGYTDEVAGGANHHHPARENNAEIIIAIGGGITSRRVNGVGASSDFVAKFYFFHTFLQTFCDTACANFTYRFYLAFDHTDPVFADEQIAAGFQRTFAAVTKKMCLEPRGVRTSLHLVQCSHTGKPTWAQNDAMMEAYIDHVDYFYRINDDTRLKTGSWAEAFVEVLEGYDPPRVGVVGPNHFGDGNNHILTYDFVHRTHVDIFGWYYPRLFTDWYGDNWITIVYQPDRSTQLEHIQLQHLQPFGSRYVTHGEVGGQLKGQVARHQPILNRYIAAVRAHNVSGVLSISSDGRRVIAMSLFGRDPRHTWGVIRNAQLVPVHFPGWRLRVYIPSADVNSPDLAVPPRLVNKLRLLGADIARVGNTSATSGFQPQEWRLLVADDRNVDFFLIRDSESRLNDRDASAVEEWVAEVKRREAAGDTDAFPVHCIRDHPKHADQVVVDGLWGGRPAALRRHLGTRLRTALYRKSSSSTFTKASASNVTERGVNITGQVHRSNSTLEEVLWPIVVGDKATAFFHDVVSPCDRWTTMKTMTKRLPFPVARQGNEYVGQKYDEHQELASGVDATKLGPDVICN